MVELLKFKQHRAGCPTGPVISSFGFVGRLRRLAATECSQTDGLDTSWRSELVEMFPEPFSSALVCVS
jgi:hypothetical protein